MMFEEVVIQLGVHVNLICPKVAGGLGGEDPLPGVPCPRREQVPCGSRECIGRSPHLFCKRVQYANKTFHPRQK